MLRIRSLAVFLSLTFALAAAARAALALSAAFPSSGAAQVCSDTPLRLTFDGAPRLGTSGRIRVFAADDSVVDTIDLGAAAQTRVIGGTTYNYLPVIIAGNTAHVQLHAPLPANATYYVQIDAGVFSDSAGVAWSGVADRTTWRFTTKAAPAAGAASVTVAEDGTGDFASVQGAFDYVPANNTRPITILLRNGTYREMLLLRNRPFVTLRGESRQGAIIAYANNANLNAGNSRCMVGIDSNDFTLENLTLRNLTPAGGSQAEALRTNSQRCLVRDVDFFSYQDTLFLTGRAYFANCLIEGDVDFIWGGGAAFFQRCEIRALRRGYNVQSRSDTGQRGYVFVDCTITAADGVTGHVLARTDTTTFPNCEVAYIDCTLSAHITPAGWTITGTGGTANLRFLEYRSRTPAGALVDTSSRAAGSRQLPATEADILRVPANVLGGWEPPGSTDTSVPLGIVTGSPAGSTNRLINLSVGALAAAGEQTLIAGFALRGAGTKPMLVRGMGPSLGVFGLTGLLADPRVQLVTQAGAVLAENNDWGANSDTLTTAGNAVGAFPLLAGSRDAALVANASPGTFNAVVTGADANAGRAIVELYDAQPDDAALGLSNLSARTQLAAGDTLTAGFVLRGTGDRAVLIRGVGPGLAAFGLSGVLADPRLELHGPNGKLFENDNWTAEVTASAARVGAFSLASGSKDAALLVTLPPGAYTALVRGAGGGVVLIEVYDVP